MHTAQTLVKESIELISLPDVYVRLRSVISTPDYSMTDVAQIIVHDPAVTARLLKLVNSPFYGLVSKVDTMSHAVNLLGVQQVHNLVLATVVVDSFSGFVNDSFNIYEYWFKSVYCAVTARLLAYHCDNLDTERPFITGLLHNIGHLLSYQKIPDESTRAEILAKNNNIDLYKAEREIMGFDYAQLGAELMREWQLPKSLQEITEFHVEPEKSDEYKIETSILNIALAITENSIAEKMINEEALAIDSACWEITGLSVNKMQDIKIEVDQQVSMVMNMIFSNRKSA